MSYKILTLNDSKEWSDLLAKLPEDQQDIYYTPEYYSLYENYGDGKAICFLYEEEGDIALYPFLINSVNGLGYDLDKEYFDIQGAYGYNGVISSTFEPNFISKFYNVFNSFCLENNVIAEFTRFHPLLSNQVLSKNSLQVVFDRETIAIDLQQSYSTIWGKEYSSGNRNMIRKAQKNGYGSNIINNPSVLEIDEFISIYFSNMRKVNAEGYYYFNDNFFHNTFSQLKSNVLLINVEDNNREVVASAIFFYYKDFFHYHLAGRTATADNTANNYLLDEAVRYAQDLGVKTFHLGGGRSISKDDSLLKFKCNFSINRLPFYIGKKIHNQEIYNEVVRQWETKNPEKTEEYKGYLLKYRLK